MVIVMIDTHKETIYNIHVVTKLEYLDRNEDYVGESALNRVLFFGVLIDYG